MSKNTAYGKRNELINFLKKHSIFWVLFLVDKKGTDHIDIPRFL